MGYQTLAQSPEILKIREYNFHHSANILKEFFSFLSLPNSSQDSEGIRKNADFIMEMMKKRGIQNVQLLHATEAHTAPSVYGEVGVPDARQTLVFYAHYDGQPVNPDQWTHGLDPYQPELFTESIEKGGIQIPVPSDGKFDPAWRIFARSASDDKAGVDAILNAYEALTKSGLLPGCNIKFFFEGEEESGSSHLNQILEKYSSLLQSDLWIICDGPVHQTGKKQIYFGVRGATGLDLTIYTSKRPLHSGHYGNWAPNPALMMSHLLASMKDEHGNVLIKGFYDDVVPLSPSEQKALLEAPRVDEQMKDELGIMTPESGSLSLYEAVTQPALNIIGIQSGNTGNRASNQIPAWARANIDLRQVLGNDWKKQQQKVIDHIRGQGYYITAQEPSGPERSTHEKIIRVIESDHGYNAQRTSMDLPISKKVIDAVRSTTSDQVVLQPTMGASLPLYLIEKYIKASVISVPIANHDNNQHAENENICVQNLFDGIETMASLMMIR
jgi:acetylornithine deacetylase/succinyl-diaminopimelate desuccinylase-like protein